MLKSIKDTVRNKVSRKIFPKELYTVERIDFGLNKPIEANDSGASTISLTNLDYLSSDVLIFADKRDVEEFKKELELIPDESYGNVAYAISQPNEYGRYLTGLRHQNILHYFIFATSEMAPEDDGEETDSMTEIESFLDKRRKR